MSPTVRLIFSTRRSVMALTIAPQANPRMSIPRPITTHTLDVKIPWPLEDLVNPVPRPTARHPATTPPVREVRVKDYQSESFLESALETIFGRQSL